MKSLFLIFNHKLTPDQDRAAINELGVAAVRELPHELQSVWSNIPAGASEISPLLEPICSLLRAEASPGDYILIQGDFGACYLLVLFALEIHCVPIYSTTTRAVSETRRPDGSVEMTRTFQHVRFRKYGV